MRRTSVGGVLTCQFLIVNLQYNTKLLNNTINEVILLGDVFF